MNSRQEEFIQQVCDCIAIVCQNQLLNVQTYVNDNSVFDVLGISDKELRVLIKKISCALANYIYRDDAVDVFNEVVAYVAREYILFQAQENIKDQNFMDHFACFIYELINTVNDTFETRKA